MISAAGAVAYELGGQFRDYIAGDVEEVMSDPLILWYLGEDVLRHVLHRQ
jgi:hypothetical protein